MQIMRKPKNKVSDSILPFAMLRFPLHHHHHHHHRYNVNSKSFITSFGKLIGRAFRSMSESANMRPHSVPGQQIRTAERPAQPSTVQSFNPANTPSRTDNNIITSFTTPLIASSLSPLQCTFYILANEKKHYENQNQ